MMFMYHSVATDANGFPDAGRKPLSEFSLVELWSALQCRMDPQKYRTFRYRDDFVLDTLEHVNEGYRMMSDHVRARAEEVLEKMRDNMEAEQDQLNTERWALVGEFSSQYTRFTQEIERLGCSSSLVGSNFVRPTDEELKDALIHRRAMEAADPALSSHG